MEQIVKVVLSRPGPYKKIIHVPPGLLAFQTQRKLLWPKPRRPPGVYSMTIKGLEGNKTNTWGSAFFWDKQPFLWHTGRVCFSLAGMISLWWARQWRMAALHPPITMWSMTPASWNPTTCSAWPTNCATCTTTGRWVLPASCLWAGPACRRAQLGSLEHPCSSKKLQGCLGTHSSLRAGWFIVTWLQQSLFSPAKILFVSIVPKFCVRSKMEIISYLQK